MKRLLNEALQITRELDDVVFIGAPATHLHTGHTRDSRYIDFIRDRSLTI